jgi:hypothetical protein
VTLNKPRFYANKITDYIKPTTLTPMELTNRFKELKHIEYQLEVEGRNRPDIKDFLDDLRKEIKKITGLKDASGNRSFFPLTRENYIQEKVSAWVEHSFKDYTLFDKSGIFRQSLPNLSSAQKPSLIKELTPDYAYCTNTFKHFAKEKFLFGKPFSRNDLIDNFKFFDLKSFDNLRRIDKYIEKGNDITYTVINDNLSSIKTIASFKGQKILNDTLFYCSEHHSIFQKREISNDFYDPIKNIIIEII